MSEIDDARDALRAAIERLDAALGNERDGQVLTHSLVVMNHIRPTEEGDSSQITTLYGQPMSHFMVVGLLDSALVYAERDLFGEGDE